MANKFPTYIAFFVISLIAYLIFFSFFGLIDTIVTAAFFISSIWLVFTQEEKIEDEAVLEEPKVHEYYKSRINIYGYMMAGNFVVSALLFYIITMNINIKQGLVALFLWAIMIAATIFISRLSQKYLFIDMISDYLAIKLKNKKVNNEDIRTVVRESYEKKTLDEKVIKNEMKDLPWDEKTKDIFAKEYIKYINENSGNILVSDEIEEINKK